MQCLRKPGPLMPCGSGRVRLPPPGWTFVMLFQDEADGAGAPPPEDDNVMVERRDGEGEPVTIDEAWRIHRAEKKGGV